MGDGRTIACATFCGISSTRISVSLCAIFGSPFSVDSAPRYHHHHLCVHYVLVKCFCIFQTVFDPMYISVYNLFYTSLPVLAVGMFDQDVNDKNSIIYPQLYRPGHYNMFFNKKEFFRSALQGCYISLVLFFIPFGE